MSSSSEFRARQTYTTQNYIPNQIPIEDNEKKKTEKQNRIELYLRDTRTMQSLCDAYS